MKPQRVIFVIATLALMVLGLQSPAGAVANATVGLWNMDEPAGSTVAIDSSGSGIDGAIGADVTAGATYDGATGYRFPYVTPNSLPTRPEHPIIVPDDPKLNPGTGDFAVTVRMRTTHSFGNIVQKGQSGAPGGYFKFENPQGIVTCLFRGPSGSRGASAGKALNDGAWHTIRCERTDAGVKMWVDGVVTGNVLGATGAISNDRPMSIGGKLNCDQVAITCDYFSGDIDYVRVEGPGSTADVTPPSTPAKPTVASPSSGKAVVTWPASTDNLATTLTYSVFRDGGTTAVGTVTGGTTGTISFTESGLVPGSSHSYRIRASDGTNTSALSPVSATLVIANAPPTGTVTIVVDGDLITVSGTATDPDGAPIVQIDTLFDGRTRRREAQSAGGAYSVAWTGGAGTRNVCVSILDTPTGAATSLGCSDVVIK